MEEPAEIQLAKIKAYSPFPGAILNQESKPSIKILDAYINDENKLIPTQVKPEGKKAMSYHDYCLGHPDGIDL